MKSAIAIVSFCSISLVAACGGQGAPGVEAPVVEAPYQYGGSTRRDLAITSTTTGVTYPYHVYLPRNYQTSGKSYPVVYATDGQWNFTSFSQTIDRKNKDVILIAIEEGPRYSKRREIDYVPAGAPKYIEFLKNEFIPLMEQQYRASSERTYVGHSYGGTLGAVLLSKEPLGEPYFKNYLLYDGAFNALTPLNVEDEVARFNASTKLNVILFLSSANPGLFVWVDAYQKRYEDRQYEGLKIHRRSYAVPHDDVAGPSFNESIDLIY